MLPRFDRTKHEARLFTRFPASDDYLAAVVAENWYKTIVHRVAIAFGFELKIRNLWKQQQNLIDVLFETHKFLIIEEYQLTRPCRIIAMVMQVCAEVAAMKVAKSPNPMNDSEFEAGIFARPYILMILPDEDIDPAILMDAVTVAHHTFVKFSVPQICLTYPGDEWLHLANAEVVFCSLNRLKKLVGQKAINLSCVKRMIVDEPLYLDDAGFEDLRMLLRHPEMDASVDTAFVGRSFTNLTRKRVDDLILHKLPSWHAHTDESLQLSKDEWHAYTNAL